MASFELPFGANAPVVFCPICGKRTIEHEDETENDFSPCAHLAFIYLDMINGFEYQSEKFKKNFPFDEFVTDEFFEDLSGSLQRAGYDNKFLALKITFGGMGHGPVWNTLIAGFDYSIVTEDQKLDE